VSASNKPAWAVADAYVFDIDGTLLNVHDGTHYNAFHGAVQSVFGVDSNIDGLAVHGSTDIAILRAVLRREGLRDSDFEPRLPAAVAAMCADVRARASDLRPEICPSIPAILERLRRRGKLLGVASGNLETIGWLKLEAAGLRPVFAFGCFSDQREEREEIFREAMAEVRRRLGAAATGCAVGDTPSDIRAARAAGMSVIAVATGTFTLAQLREFQPDACVSCCTDLLSCL
jgi:phosphoglycolate phosphatase-like HAD superfamily hydrolase